MSRVRILRLAVECMPQLEKNFNPMSTMIGSPHTHLHCRKLHFGSSSISGDIKIYRGTIIVGWYCAWNGAWICVGKFGQRNFGFFAMNSIPDRLHHAIYIKVHRKHVVCVPAASGCYVNISCG